MHAVSLKHLQYGFKVSNISITRKLTYFFSIHKGLCLFCLLFLSLSFLLHISLFRFSLSLSLILLSLSLVLRSSLHLSLFLSSSFLFISLRCISFYTAHTTTIFHVDISRRMFCKDMRSECLCLVRCHRNTKANANAPLAI